MFPLTDFSVMNPNLLVLLFLVSYETWKQFSDLQQFSYPFTYDQLLFCFEIAIP